VDTLLSEVRNAGSVRGFLEDFAARGVRGAGSFLALTLVLESGFAFVDRGEVFFIRVLQCQHGTGGSYALPSNEFN
jgi:hypothetical protein